MGCIPIFGYKKPDVDNSPILGAHILFMGCLPLGFQKKMVDEFFASSLLSWIPMGSSLISHSGAESAGVLMGFYLPLYFLVLICLNERLALGKAA
jgi:hypothetical protein